LLAKVYGSKKALYLGERRSFGVSLQSLSKKFHVTGYKIAVFVQKGIFDYDEWLPDDV
jgi:aspartate/methionine/tyrosine aminotransferase